MLYFSLIHPYLTYGIILWGSAQMSHLQKLVVLQKKAIRAVTKSNYNEHTGPLFKQLCIPNIIDLYAIALCKLIYNHLHGESPEPLTKLFVRNAEIHTHNTRHMNDIHLTPLHTNIAHRSFIQNTPNLWLNITRKY